MNLAQDGQIIESIETTDVGAQPANRSLLSEMKLLRPEVSQRAVVASIESPGGDEGSLTVHYLNKRTSNPYFTEEEFTQGLKDRKHDTAVRCPFRSFFTIPECFLSLDACLASIAPKRYPISLSSQ